jgi:hypothetical protein
MMYIYVYYRSQNETLKKEILDQERGLKCQLAALEKKAHENWVRYLSSYELKVDDDGNRLLKLDFWTLSIVPDCLNDKIVKKTNTVFLTILSFRQSGTMDKVQKSCFNNLSSCLVNYFVRSASYL